MNAFDKLMSRSKVYLKPRKKISGYISKIDDIVPAPEYFNDSFTDEQKIVYKKLAYFVENSVPVEYYKDVISEYFYKDMTSVIIQFFHHSYLFAKDRVMLLHGSAGSGKTYVTSVLIGTLLRNIKNNERICVIAPTHKAKKIISLQVLSILKKMSINHNYDSVWFSTISKFLEQKPVYDNDGKSQFRTHIDSENLSSLRYLFIDEASMISMKNWEDLKKYVINKLPRLAVVIMGDDHQLSPVGEKTSKVIQDVSNRVDLTEIIRANSACMIRLYKTFRIFVDNRKVFISEKLENQDCFTRTHNLERYIRDKFNPRYDKILSYSNSSVDRYNKLARNILFGDNAPRFLDSDILIFTGIYKHGPKTSTYFYTNDEIEILESSVSNVSVNNTIDLYSAKERRKLKEFFPLAVFRSHKIKAVYNGKVYTFNVIHEDHEYKFKEYMRRSRGRLKSSMRFNTEFSNSDIWSLYWDVHNYLNCPIKYSYALTIYKSQGSTYRYAFIDARNVANCVKNNSNIQYTKTIYTAITRASDHIYYADLLPIDEKIDTQQIVIKDISLWPYLKKYILTDIGNLKPDQVIRVTSSSNTPKKRKIQIVQVINVTQKFIYVTDNTKKFKISIKDTTLAYTKN